MNKTIIGSVTMLIALCAVVTSSASAQTADKSSVARKGESVPLSVVKDTNYFYDGPTRRVVSVDAARTVRFDADGKTRVLASSFSQEKSLNGSSTQTESPLFIENGKRRALPGGLIIILKQANSEAEARAQLVAQGFSPVRMIAGDPSARTWLVAGPAGIESLNTANRLHESGQFASVSPNWWTELSKK